MTAPPKRDHYTNADLPRDTEPANDVPPVAALPVHQGRPQRRATNDNGKSRRNARHKKGPELLTLSEAAARLGVSARTVRRSIDLGRIQAQFVPVGTGRGVWRIPETEIERIKASGNQYSWG